jgi:hypothetical protein
MMRVMGGHRSVLGLSVILTACVRKTAVLIETGEAPTFDIPSKRRFFSLFVNYIRRKRQATAIRLSWYSFAALTTARSCATYIPALGKITRELSERGDGLEGND